MEKNKLNYINTDD